MNNNSNVQTLDTSTVEFTNDGNAPQPQGEERDESKATRDHELGGSVYATELQRNELFSTSGDAIAGFRAWQASDRNSMAYIDRAVKEALTKFAMHREPGKANVAPLTHAVLAMEHRGKKNLASKLIAFVQAVTNYKWAVDTKSKAARFRLKKDKDVNTTFTPAQKAIYDAPFYEYVKPAVKKDWKLEQALKSLLAKAQREGFNTAAQEQAMKDALALVELERKNEAEHVAGTAIRNDFKNESHARPVDTLANDKDAA